MSILNVVLSAAAHFEACSATQPSATSQSHALTALPECQQVSSLEGTPWREAWLLTFGMGDEVVSEWGVGAGVMERGAAGARGCHAPRAQSQQLCGHGEAGAGQNGDKEKQ